MELLTNYDDDILGYDRGHAPSRQKPIVYSLIYPPIGFFPFYGARTGNGDCFGYYWPIGRESGSPIVAFTSHDVWSLIPKFSSIESMYRCCLARSNDDDQDSLEDYRLLVEAATHNAPAEHDLRDVAHDDFQELLSLDPTSPYYLCAAADVDLANDRIDAAEQRYRRSLDQLPEYAAAHFGLACVLRRQRRLEDAAIHLRMSLVYPSAFHGGSLWSDSSLPGLFRNDGRRKAVLWLRGAHFGDELLGDPFVNQIHQLTFREGDSESRDIEILQSIVEQYTVIGNYSEAACIWRLIGERAACETISFRERYQLNPRTYGTRLAELLELSGNAKRAALVRSMLRAMPNPEGLQL